MEAPELSIDLDKRYHDAMGGAWQFIVRMVATGKALETLCTSYQAAPILPDLTVKFTADKVHPNGRARWLWKGYPLARLEKSGIQDRLTNSRMRKMRFKAEIRMLLTGVELRRRSLTRDLKYYTGLIGGFLKRSREALASA